METPEYMVINPMHMKVLMQDYTVRNGPIKIKEKYVENKRDIKCYYMRSIFKKGYIYY
tara:strand:- start:1563 stop:1736 length:174 start_codon:yes stop_codon:yes gene_type:complete